MKTLQERLIWARSQKAERDNAEFTQTDLAAKAGVSQGAIAHLESGRTKTSRNLTAIAEALGVHPRWLAEGKGPILAHELAVRPAAISDEHEIVGNQTDDAKAARTISLIWADKEDLELLTFFHGTDADGRSKILRTAQRVPRVVAVSTIAHEP